MKHSIQFDYVKLKPSEQIGSHQQPTWELSLIIKGEGIRVPKGARVLFIGDGELDMECDVNGKACIGGGASEDFGEIVMICFIWLLKGVTEAERVAPETSDAEDIGCAASAAPESNSSSEALRPSSS